MTRSGHGKQDPFPAGSSSRDIGFEEKETGIRACARKIAGDGNLDVRSDRIFESPLSQFNLLNNKIRRLLDSSYHRIPVGS